jgi:hypothetical protein
MKVEKEFEKMFLLCKLNDFKEIWKEIIWKKLLKKLQ